MVHEINLHIRILCLHGEKGQLKSVLFKCSPSTTRVADLKTWIATEQPAEDVELVHQGNPMSMQSDLIEYDIVAAPVIDAILTLSQQDQDIALVDSEVSGVTTFADFKGTTFSKELCSEAKTLNGTEHVEQSKKAKLHFLQRRSKMGKREHQFHRSVHIYALVACDEGAMRIDFCLNMDLLESCATISNIKESVRTWIDEASADVEVMLVSDRSTPLGDHHSFKDGTFPSELFAVISI